MLMERMEQAHKLALEDVNRCKTDLQIATNSIFALENEYTGIRNKARYCDRGRPQEVQVLRG
jgi:hypothetical protein